MKDRSPTVPKGTKRKITAEHRAKIMANLEKAHDRLAERSIALEAITNPALPPISQGHPVTGKVTDPQPFDNSPISILQIGRRSLRTRLLKYIGGIESVRDFDRVRKLSPLRALEFATSYIWGKPKVQDAPPPKSPQSLGVLVQVLCGKEPQAVVVSSDSIDPKPTIHYPSD